MNGEETVTPESEIAWLRQRLAEVEAQLAAAQAAHLADLRHLVEEVRKLFEDRTA